MNKLPLAVHHRNANDLTETLTEIDVSSAAFVFLRNSRGKYAQKCNITLNSCAISNPAD
jgi:hypothetical protein